MSHCSWLYLSDGRGMSKEGRIREGCNKQPHPKEKRKKEELSQRRLPKLGLRGVLWSSRTANDRVVSKWPRTEESGENNQLWPSAFCPEQERTMEQPCQVIHLLLSPWAPLRLTFLLLQLPSPLATCCISCYLPSPTEQELIQTVS